MRTIKAYRRTTPTFVYNITDAQAAGVDMENLKICMSIKFGSGILATEPTVYVLPVNDDSDMFDFAGTDPTYTKVWSDPTYCRRDPNSNSFAITLPLWKLPNLCVSDAIFQVFLFGESERTSGTTLIDGSIIPSVVNRHNILIDEGDFFLEDSILPPLVAEPKRDGTDTKFYI